MRTLADKILDFNKNLHFGTKPVKGIKSMNPFQENPTVWPMVNAFYARFYGDNQRRKMILGINPGRLGAGATGIPFTDTKRLLEVCGIQATCAPSHEPSSVFVYELIAEYGGAMEFYKNYYINSVCPLGFIRKNQKGNWVNCNYYDYPKLFQNTRPFIIENLRKQIQFGMDTNTCLVLGKKNAQFLVDINAEENMFEKIVALDHPRYIVQYKSKQLKEYIKMYLEYLK